MKQYAYQILQFTFASSRVCGEAVSGKALCRAVSCVESSTTPTQNIGCANVLCKSISVLVDVVGEIHGWA